MNRRSRVVGASVLLAVLTSCSARTGTGGASISDQAAACNAVDVAVNSNNMMADQNADGHAVSFSSIVMEDQPTKLGDGISAALALSLTDDGYGPYDPVLRYLAQRVVARDEEIGDGVAVPQRTAKVIRSAKALDRDLAEGMCPRPG